VSLYGIEGALKARQSSYDFSNLPYVHSRHVAIVGLRWCYPDALYVPLIGAPGRAGGPWQTCDVRCGA